MIAWMSVPSFLQSVLWSYDLRRMDPRRDKWTIITQILNYGGKRALEWMEKTYSADEMLVVLSHPQRGVWFREKLQHWLKKFDLVIDPLEFEVAIFSLIPRPELTRKYFERRGVIPVNLVGESKT